MRNHVLVLVALIGFGAAACGGSAHHDDAASTPTAVTPESGNGPLPRTSPSSESDTGTCTTVSYKVTAAGVEIDARVAKTPAKLNVEADDADDNPVTGDPRTSGTDYAFSGSETRHTIVLKGVRSPDHVTVIALDTGRDDSCRATRR